jgi:hypothetical protein
MYKSLKSRWSMEKTGQAFTNMVSWGVMYYWVDCYGQRWMAEQKWGFRVRVK